ncbi:hypothetical protein, partial [Pseudoramibacter alactolyticus]|uniref:hypothetical protein n=1 Tax=Pseudoramibacter alactolyticus TaxID=113287 RepID=UPI001A97D864
LEVVRISQRNFFIIATSILTVKLFLKVFPDLCSLVILSHFPVQSLQFNCHLPQTAYVIIRTFLFSVNLF